MALPEIVNQINKDKKTIKITTMSRAKSMYIKRFPSGSYSLDAIIGGGFAFRRMMMLYGQKSCLDGDSFLNYEVWVDGVCTNHKGGSIQRLYEQFTGDVSDGVKYGRHLQNNDAIFYVKSVNENNAIVRNEVLDVVNSGKKECYQVTTNSNHKLISTMKHKYLTATGYKPLSELKIGDIIYVSNNNRKTGRKKQTTREAVCVKYHPQFPIKIVKEKYNGVERDYIYYRGQKSHIIYEAFLNNLTYDAYLSVLNTKSKDEINKLIFLPKGIHVHHKDENFLNNDLANLELIDPKEHGRLHMQDRIDNLRIHVEESTITAIDYVGERETYDLKCAYPYNNYIANGIVVHNSGKNALLYQTMAYNQRICRHCGGVLPSLVKEETSSHIISGVDRWSNALINYMNYPICGCAKSEGRIFLFMDYEKSLSMEKPRNKIIKNVVDKKTGAVIDEALYDDLLSVIKELQGKETLSDDEKVLLKDKEKLLKTFDVTTQEIPMLDTTDYLQKCGVNVDALLVADPADAEEGINYLGDLIPSRQVDVIIIDSLQSMLPQYVKGRDAEDATMGVEAKVNGLMSRKVCSAYAAENIEDEAEAYKPALFLISQVRNSLGGFSGGQPTFSGGHAIAHHISLALEFKREMYLKEDGNEASFKEAFFGQKTRVRAEKNKLSAPGDFALYDYYFRDGINFGTGQIDHIEEITTMAIDNNIIERAGAYYKTNGESFQGKIALVNYMRENPKFVGTIFSQVKG